MNWIYRDLFRAALIVATAFVATLLLFGCASTVTGTGADGNPVSIKVGFGNRITTPGYTVEPSEAVVNAAERTAQYAIQTAPDAILKAAQTRQE